MSVQAVVYCTPGRAKKVVIALAIVSMISNAIFTYAEHLVSFLYIFDIYTAVYLVLPMTVLVVNLLVLREVLRASNSASTNLGRQQPEQTAPSNSAVPTVMLITTSLIYVFLSGTWSIFHIYVYWPQHSGKDDVRSSIYIALMCLQRLIFVYNFFVYLITGRQFRSELRSLCCCCCTSATDAAPDNEDDVRVPRDGVFVSSNV